MGSVALLLHRKKPDPQTYAETTPPDNHQPTKLKPPSYAHRHYEHPTEEEHRTEEQFAWRNSLALNVAIASVAVLGLIAAGGTLIYTRSQANAAWQSYIASSRAWESVTPNEQTFFLTWNQETGISLEGDFDIINHGNSPGLDSLFGPWFGFYYQGTDISGSAKKACENTDKHQIGGLELPGDLFPTHVVSILKADFVQQFRKNMIDRNFLPDDKPIGIVYAVCVVYRITSDQAWHHTGRAYRLGTVVTSTSNPIGLISWSQSVAAGSMVLARVAAGDYAD